MRFWSVELAARVALLACWPALGCAGSVGSGAAAATASSAGAAVALPATASAADVPLAPVAPPIVSVTGCVESRELHDYVLSLEARRAAARAQALSALGVRAEERRGQLGEPGAALDSIVEQGERRWAVVGMLASGFEPTISVARAGTVLHRIDERPRAHATSVLSCSEQRCPARTTGPSTRGEVRPLLIELAPGESLGAPLLVGYDYWWARVRYASAERCSPGSAPAASH